MAATLRPPPPPSAAEDDANAKSQRLTTSTKICIVCSSYTDEYDYIVFIVDPNSEIGRNVDGDKSGGPTALVPTLQIGGSCFGQMAFCVLGSKLFMFETMDADDMATQKSMYTFDLSGIDAAASDLKLERSDLSKGPDMLATKLEPVALPTGDGRILVFSYISRFRFYDDTQQDIDFELYDPTTESWKQLPDIRFDPRMPLSKKSHFQTESYSVNDSKIFISTDISTNARGIMFFLDLNSLDKGWQILNLFPENSPRTGVIFGGELFWGAEDICFGVPCAFDIDKSRGVFRPLLFPFPESFSPLAGRANWGITLLDKEEDNSRCHLCMVQTIDSLSPPLLMMDIHHFDLVKYRQDRDRATAEKRPLGDFTPIRSSIVKSFKFVLNTVKSTLFSPSGVFHMS